MFLFEHGKLAAAHDRAFSCWVGRRLGKCELQTKLRVGGIGNIYNPYPTYVYAKAEVLMYHKEKPSEWHEISAECFSGMRLRETRNIIQGFMATSSFLPAGCSTRIFSTFLFKLKPAGRGVGALQCEISLNGFGVLMKFSQHPAGFKHLQQLLIPSGPPRWSVFAPLHVPACSEPYKRHV